MTDTDTEQDWELAPFEGVGPLRFGMSRDRVIEALGEPDRTLSQDPVLEESHRAARVQTVYDGANRLIAAQLVRRRPVSFRGLALGGRSLDEVREGLERLGIASRRDDLGVAAPDIGLRLYAPAHTEPAPYLVEAVLAASRDYEELIETSEDEE